MSVPSKIKSFFGAIEGASSVKQNYRFKSATIRGHATPAKFSNEIESRSWGGESIITLGPTISMPLFVNQSIAQFASL